MPWTQKTAYRGSQAHRITLDLAEKYTICCPTKKVQGADCKFGCSPLLLLGVVWVLFGCYAHKSYVSIFENNLDITTFSFENIDIRLLIIAIKRNISSSSLISRTRKTMVQSVINTEKRGFFFFIHAKNVLCFVFWIPVWVLFGCYGLKNRESVS